MKKLSAQKVKMTETIQSNYGDVFRKGSIVLMRPSYGGYELSKIHRRKDGTVISVTRVKDSSFAILANSPDIKRNTKKGETPNE